MLKTYIEINLTNKDTNKFDKKIKEKLFSNDIFCNLQQLLNNIIIKEFHNTSKFFCYNMIKNNKIFLSSYDGLKQLHLSNYNHNYHFNSFDNSHSYLYFFDYNNNISYDELNFINSKLKIYIEKYLNYKINEINIFVDTRF